MATRLIVCDRVGIMDRTAFYAPGEIGKTRRLTPEGFMVCEGVAIARTGSQRYHKSELPLLPDGAGEITVTRPYEEVFNRDTIASFEGKPVTVEHPNEFVTPDSWKRHAVGTVQNVRRGKGIEDDMLIADLLITDGEAIAYVNAKRPELSCGYDAEYEQTDAGSAIQRNIIGNHVALVDRGRAGPRCAIRDASDPTQDFLKQMRDDFNANEKRDANGRWSKGGKPRAKKSALEFSAEAHTASAKAQASGEKEDHWAALGAHLTAAGEHAEGNKKASSMHMTAAKIHMAAFRARQRPSTPERPSSAAKSRVYFNLGDISMKSRFADKFLRVMTAFSAKDAVALDRELATDDHSTEDDDVDHKLNARINDALAWIDEQRQAAIDAQKQKDQEEEDCEMEKKKAKDAQAAKDSAAALDAARVREVGVFGTTDEAQVMKHILARAEILSPGISVPTGDAAKAKDAMPALMLAAVKLAYATEAGKAVIDPFLLGQPIEAVTTDNVPGVFTGAAELMRQRNNNGAKPGKLTVKDFSHPVSPSSLNEVNRKFWEGRAS